VRLPEVVLCCTGKRDCVARVATGRVLHLVGRLPTDQGS